MFCVMPSIFTTIGLSFIAAPKNPARVQMDQLKALHLLGSATTAELWQACCFIHIAKVNLSRFCDVNRVWR